MPTKTVTICKDVVAALDMLHGDETDDINEQLKLALGFKIKPGDFKKDRDVSHLKVFEKKKIPFWANIKTGESNCYNIQRAIDRYGQKHKRAYNFMVFADYILVTRMR